MTQHRLNRCTLFLLQLQRLSDVLTGLFRPAQEVQHEGAVAYAAASFGFAFTAESELVRTASS